MTDIPQIEHATASDGARIACRRRPGDGAPVVFLHGLAVNADLWDIPDIRADTYEFRSLATLLHERGYDLWLVNWRGHGAPHMLSAPPAASDDYCVDDFILYDLPAVLDLVCARTGAAPFVIGNSMGAMTLAGCLQGAVLVGDGAALRIVADEQEAQRRQAQVAGGVFVEFPAQLRWPRSMYDDAGAVRWNEVLRDWSPRDPAMNYAFEAMARSDWLRSALHRTGRLPLDWLRPPPAAGAWWDALPPPLADALRWGNDAFAQALGTLVERARGSKNLRPEVFTRGLLRAADHLKAGVLDQMGKSVRARSFVSALGAPDHDYSAHYDRIEVPALVIAGARDRIANADVTREAFFDRIRSRDKEFLLFDDLTHGEFEYTPAATERVYPRIIDWIARRDRRGT